MALSRVRPQLMDPLEFGPPEPTPGCDVCGALARQIERAERPNSPEYDPSKATDLRVEMRRHQSGEVTR